MNSATVRSTSETSSDLAADVSEASPSRRLVAAAVAGNALEFYDFFTYAFFAVYIGKTFFPSSSPLTSLLLSVAVFGVGFVTRPIGAILIGLYADRAGRKPAMLLTIALVTVGTLGLVVCPGYDSIGLAAPIIVVLCRLVQGLALGGEIGPATSFLVEMAPARHRGLVGSWQLASQGLAMLAGGVVGVVLSKLLSQDALQSWGWRAAFALGLLIIPVAMYLRRAMPDTPVATAHSKPAGSRSRLLRQNTRLITIASFALMSPSVTVYVVLYMTTYAIATLKMPPAIAMAATVVSGLVTLLASLFGGWLSDRVGRKPVMIIPRVLLLLLAYPAFLLLVDQKSYLALLGVTGVLALLNSISAAAALVAVPELLPREVRATGMSIAYTVGGTLFGGATQLLITWMIGATGNPTSPAWLLAATALVTLFALWMMPEGKGKAL